LRYLNFSNSKSFNGNTNRNFEKVDSSSGEEDVAKNSVKVIRSGVDKFWAKRGKIDSNKTKGFLNRKKCQLNFLVLCFSGRLFAMF